MHDPARGGGQYKNNHHAQRGSHAGVDARGSLNAVAVESREEQCEEDDQYPIGNAGQKDHGRAAAPDGANQRIEDIVHDQAPAGDIAEGGMDFPADIKEGRAPVGIDAGHAAIADGGEHHGHHGQQNHRDHVPPRNIVEHAEHRHGRRGLDENDAVEHQVPEAQAALQANGSGS